MVRSEILGNNGAASPSGRAGGINQLRFRRKLPFLYTATSDIYFEICLQPRG